MLKQPRLSHGSPGTKAPSEMRLGALPGIWPGATGQKQLKFRELEKSFSIQDQFYFNSIILEINAKSQQWKKISEFKVKPEHHYRFLFCWGLCCGPHRTQLRIPGKPLLWSCVLADILRDRRSLWASNEPLDIPYRYQLSWVGPQGRNLKSIVYGGCLLKE